MRSGPVIAIVTATLIAIGVALGSSTGGRTASRFDDFETIYYQRDIEHEQLALLGDCPLGREIAIERSGKTKISWYAQMPDHHGCVRAIGFEPQNDDQQQRDEPVVASIELALGESDMDRLQEALNKLRWQIDWHEPKDFDYALATGCEPYTNSFSDRTLSIVRPGPIIANLRIYGEKIRAYGDAYCTANEIANVAILDDAVASFAPSLPAQYDLRPAVAKRLYRVP